jgi:hypothetical protein
MYIFCSMFHGSIQRLARYLLAIVLSSIHSDSNDILLAKTYRKDPYQVEERVVTCNPFRLDREVLGNVPLYLFPVYPTWRVSRKGLPPKGPDGWNSNISCAPC